MDTILHSDIGLEGGSYLMSYSYRFERIILSYDLLTWVWRVDLILYAVYIGLEGESSLCDLMQFR